MSLISQLCLLKNKGKRMSISVIPVYCSRSKKADFRGELRAMKSMSFTVFSYNATILLIQPNPTHHMCWKMAPCGLGGVVEEAHLVSWPSVVRGN